jgi:aspartyl-tRNA(Asn)/glutamyl-tRNA(Gln) amidotransferase subunit A
VPIDPPYLGRVAGPMTRSVADAALMMATLAQPDARDFMSLPPQRLDWRVAPAKLDGVRIGVLLEAGCGYATAAPVRAAVERAGRDFAAAGAIVEPLAPFLTQEMLDGLDRFWRTRALVDMRAMPPERRKTILPFILEWAESAASFSGEVVFQGFSQIMAMRKAAVRATQPYDFVILPTAPITAFEAELASPSKDPLNPLPHVCCTVAFNMSEQPAASINCAYSAEGLPIGLQIVGRRFDDLGVLGVAMAFEAMRASEARAWPEPPAT